MGEGPLTRRVLGVPWLWAVAYSAVGFSIYFSIGVVADRGLGLTPLVFLVAGFLFVLATFSYVEGSAMFLERGGSSSFARHAFNELVSFIAGWAILIDYLIVISLASVSVPHYLSPIWGGFTHGWAERVVVLAVIGFAAIVNIAGFTGHVRQRPLIVLALADVALQVAVILVGVAVVFDTSALTAHVHVFSMPSGKHILEALAVATLAFAGIEAASDLAPDLEWRPRDLRRVVSSAAVVLPLIYAGMAAIALMAVPVVTGPDGAQTALGHQYIEEPVLGVVKAYDPAWLSTILQVGVVAVAPVVLAWAASTSMLGLSRHVYVLARNRQVPSWLGKLGPRSTPYLAIAGAAVISFALALPTDVRLLAGLYAFGATLAIAIAHLSVIRLRWTEPDLDRPYRMPFDVSFRGRALPLPAIVGAVLMGLLWLTVIVFREKARWVGGGWMLFGLIAYLIYRRYVEHTSLTKRVSVPEEALRKEVGEAEYENILVPIFGTELDDDIVSTAGRLADAADQPGEAPPKLEILYVVDLPLTVPLDAPPPKGEMEMANKAIERAMDVANEYDTVEVAASVERAREVGAGIIQAARDRGSELIVMGGEPPTSVRGGPVLGGRGSSRPPAIGPVTEYVLKKAPCKVLITAPPEHATPLERQPA